MFSLSHIHPLIVHFPIALVIIGFITEIASFIFKKEEWISKAGFYLLIIGTLSALAALLTGSLFTDEMKGIAGDVQETHENFAWVSIGVLLFVSILRFYILRLNKKNTVLNRLAFALYGLAAILVGITGFYGGTLVYNYMMPL
ncbi:MAG: DUF2231 domain-containing protein [Bacteroidales bacterium]